MNTKQQGDKPHPWDKISFVSRYAFWWTIPILKLGWKNELNVDDLEDCPVNTGSRFLGDKLEKEWQKELQLQKTKKKYKASLRRAVIRMFGKSFVLLTLFLLFTECGIRILQPLCLGWLIQYFNYPGSLTDTEGYLSAAGVCILGYLQVIITHPVMFKCFFNGMRIRIASCTLIYNKSLKLSQRAMGKTTVGQMVNLLTNDVNRFDLSLSYLPYFFVGPIQLAIVIGILWRHLGVSCIYGVLVLLMVIPFQGYMGRLFSKLRSKTARLTDERIRLMNEIVAGMRVIKMYTWEHPFANIIELARRKEIEKIRQSSILRGFNIAVYFAASKIIVFVCFITFVLMGHPLTAEIVFVSVSLYNNVRLTMTAFFPMAITTWAESSISFERIQKFLELEEQEQVATVDRKIENDEHGQCGLWIDSVSAKWNEESNEMNLNDINMNVKSGELWAVVGPVGSGKTSLLMSILGELPTTNGNIKIRGKLAYASQEPWVFAGTIEKNILFGQPMDQDKYERVLRVCALNRDLKILPYGDQTLVGERGVSLSGGQKARVNLARAIYTDADVYLMDDPLSAVDVSVAKHLFEKCINGYVKDKARILVTHQVQFLKSAHRIIILKHGKVEAVGGYEELVSQGFDLLSIVDEETARKRSLAAQTSQDNSESAEKVTLNDTTSFPSSTTSMESTGPFLDKNIAPKEVSELKSEGSVKASTYINYVKSGGGIFLISSVILLNIVTQVIYTYSDYWLSLWTNAEDAKSRKSQNETDDSNSTFIITYDSSTGLTWESVTGDFADNYDNTYYYSGLMVALFVFSLMRSVVTFLLCMKSSVQLHNAMFRSVSRAPIDFFDKNPIGRILNRFTKDLGLIDDLLPFTFVDTLMNSLVLLGTLVLVIYVSPFTSIPTFLLVILSIFIRKFYIITASELKRLEGITRSPVFSHLSTSVYGIATIRSSGSQTKFIKEFCSLQDNHTSTYFNFLSVNRWFGLNLDQLTVIYITCLTIFLITIDTGATGGNVGLAISSALFLTGTFQWTIRQSTELESQMTAVERVLEYGQLKPEAELVSSPGKKPSREWPQEGNVTFRDLSLTYPGSGDVPVLKDLNCEIKGGEKVGIVGRTGAGKSSIIAALFRMTEPTGTIIIDGVNVLDIGLHDLRSKISIIPQDPILFSGAVRRNLDPFNEKTDVELWGVLEEVQLKEAVLEMSGGLDNKMSEGGTNLSVGQRQLVCLARALLRQNKILVLDEATANVDHETDTLIQNTIRRKFRHCTVLTIAHRLNTIMDSDKIMVLDAGNIVEFDEPIKLLDRDTSQLADMVKQTGPTIANQLYHVALKLTEL